MKPKHIALTTLSAIGFLAFMAFIGYLGASTQRASEPIQGASEATSGYESYQPTSEPTSRYESYQRATDPASLLVKHCAREAGIPDDEPQHRITPQEMRDLTDCTDRAMGR